MPITLKYLYGMVFAGLYTFIRTMENHEFESLKGLRVLVVEDNSINQRLYSRILMQWEVSADIAVNGKVALEMVEKTPYDVVLMDIMMPELDGYEATRAIRAMDDQYFRALPIYAFSACPDPEQIVACAMNGHITKSPLDKAELYRKISSYHKS